MLYKRLIINGTEYPLAVSQSGVGAPGAATSGAEGVLYMDTVSALVYLCTGGGDGNWNWVELGQGGSNAGSGGTGGSDSSGDSFDISDLSWECGTINSTGANLTNNYRMRTVGAAYLPQGTVISTGGQYMLSVAEYSEFTSVAAYSFRVKSDFNTEDYTTTTDGYVRIILMGLDENTRFADSEDFIAAAAATVSVDTGTTGSGIGTASGGSGSGVGHAAAQDSIPRVILPYYGYRFEATTAEDSEAPASGNLAKLYAKWDGLAEAYPNHVTMEVLGTDASGTYEIRCYTISSNSDSFKWTLEKPQTNLKILWLSGMHGHESTIFVDDLMFFTELLKQENEVTARLMDNCTFKVIPAVSPWGYENGSRINSNGVNINRNFETKWELTEEGNDYSGTEPMSEAETQIVAQFLADNEDCYMAINRHSSSAFAPTSVLGYFVSQFEVDRKLAYNMARFMSNQIKRSAMYSYITNADTSDAAVRCLHTVEESGATGTMDKYFNALGIHGYLYEASPCSKVGDDCYAEDFGRQVWQCINVTNIGNLLYSLMLQNEYVDI